MPRADGSLTTTERGLGWDYERHARRIRNNGVGTPCPTCGVIMVRASNLPASCTVDHKIPRHRGGTNHPSNLWARCRRCNLGEGGRAGAAMTNGRRARRRAIVRLITSGSF
jgi:5-methylcytosine-specific restriction endonuclease McrA